MLSKLLCIGLILQKYHGSAVPFISHALIKHTKTDCLNRPKPSLTTKKNCVATNNLFCCSIWYMIQIMWYHQFIENISICRIGIWIRSRLALWALDHMHQWPINYMVLDGYKSAFSSQKWHYICWGVLSVFSFEFWSLGLDNPKPPWAQWTGLHSMEWPD